ncbi:hypothetical protein CLV51_1069 [Chitinophaga niastensis]|uniref:Uncharacterized protein n=1 Tax=Chitinophaga niastensis TaxID=536980 RepID=A0A2P8HD24_CHINA|nr:hypothetical protein [Chitinophaga niastensis]PSL44144.1 hypothetical protein CLV51_1069 [Chitinophaga niastensis]
MKKSKKYDAVAEVRKIREELSLKYWGHTELLLKDLKAVRERYAQRLKTIEKH